MVITGAKHNRRNGCRRKNTNAKTEKKDNCEKDQSNGESEAQTRRGQLSVNLDEQVLEAHTETTTKKAYSPPVKPARWRSAISPLVLDDGLVQRPTLRFQLLRP